MSGNEIVKLSEYRHSRLRTEMYLGSRSPHTQTIVNWNGSSLAPQEMTWVPAVFCAWREIMDNALDEVVGHGHGSRIDITYDPLNLRFSVSDDGRGIPIDWDENERMHKVTMALTQTRTGRNFGERGEVRGTNGIGSSIVVNCSRQFKVTVHRDGQKFSQTFSEGSEILPELDIGAPVITRGSSSRSGTQVEWELSQEVFGHRQLPLEFVRARVMESAVNHPNIRFSFNGERVAVKPNIDKTFFSQQSCIKIPVREGDFASTFYLVPNFCVEGEHVHCLVNDIPAFNGGSHIDVFKRSFFSNLIKALERESRKRALTPNKSDISEGILVYNVTTMKAPNFDSQSKTRLINEEVETHIRLALDNESLYKSIVKNHREWIDEIYERCATRTQKRDDQEAAKLSRKVLRTKVPKLMDATGKDRSKCILLITEGDCIHEDTKIAIFENGGFIHRKIKDVSVGDLVLTHTGSIKPIHNKQAKISQGLEIQTASGQSLVVSPEHQLMIFNKTSQKYEFVEAQNLDYKQHCLIKSLLNLDIAFFEIDDISDFDDEKFNCAISYHNNTVKQTTLISKQSLCAVFDITQGKIEMMKVLDIDPDIHLMIANNL